MGNIIMISKVYIKREGGFHQMIFKAMGCIGLLSFANLYGLNLSQALDRAKENSWELKMQQEKLYGDQASVGMALASLAPNLSTSLSIS
jgi:hypothetical protein